MATAHTFVSLLVTVFNREHILAETLASILNSSFTDFEVVVVDDCSVDNSVAVARAVAKSDKRIKVFVNEQNLGDYENRNRAASLATGTYLKYLDADDLIYRHSLATMVEAMEVFPDAALALSRNLIDPEEPYPKLYSSKEFFREHFFHRSPIGVGPSAAIIRRECFEAVGGFSGKQFVGDTELWMKLAERWPIVALPPGLVWWRMHTGQQMQLEQRRPEVLNTRVKLELDVLESTVHLNPEEKRQASLRVKQHHARRLLSMVLKRGQLQTACRLFRASGLAMSDLIRGCRPYE